MAVERVLEVSAPESAASRSPINVTIEASTDARAGEQIGFLPAEFPATAA